MAQVKVIAHRGFWETEGSAQNSITGLQKADSIGCYGSEFDVRMSKDGELIVVHNFSHKYKSISGNNAATLTRLSLQNGETLSTLTNYLKEGAKLNIKLILELKKLDSPEQETQAVEKIVSLVSTLKLEQRIEYISFSLHAVKEFIRLSPSGTPVYYLNGDLSPQQLKDIGCAGADYNYEVYRKKPHWISECHDLGLKVNVWTVNKEKEMQWLIDRKVDFITTDQPLLLEKIKAFTLQTETIKQGK